jgi:hypothetical protein
MGSDSDRPLPNMDRGQPHFCFGGARVLARVLKIEICEFPSVLECPRVLNLAINAHEIL